jgi:ethanolamine utilization protein EutP (predicted NTPase)
MKYVICFAMMSLATLTWAADSQKSAKHYKKTQEVNFDGSDVDGVIRSPDGAYLLQKRGVKFNSLYKVDNQMEKGILDSVQYLK